MSLGAEDFITTNGAVEALHLALRAVAKPGDAIAVESPTYFGVLQLIEELGLKAVEVPTHPRSGFDLDALEEVIRTTPSLKAVLAMPTVSNPMGTVMSDAAKEKLVRLVARYEIDLIEDDAYGELVFDSPRPRPARAWDREGRVLFCGSVSKTLAPGYRVGWIAPGRHQERVEQLKFAFTVASPTLPQMAVAEFLASGGYDRHLRRLRATLRGQVDRVREARGPPAGRGVRGLGRIATGRRCAGVAVAGTGPGDRDRSGADLLGAGAVRALSSPVMRLSVVCEDRGSNRDGWRAGDGAAVSAAVGMRQHKRLARSFARRALQRFPSAATWSRQCTERCPCPSSESQPLFSSQRHPIRRLAKR